MKTGNKQRVSHKDAVPAANRRRFPLKILPIILAVLAFGGVCTVAVTIFRTIEPFLIPIGSDAHAAVVQKDISQYLTKKYDENFVVAKPKFKGQMLGYPAVWETTAYPQNKPELTFTVSSEKISTDPDETYHDNYVAAIWTKQQQPAIQQESRKVYGSRSSVTVSGEIDTPGSDLVLILTKTSPTYEEALRNYSDDLGYKVTVRSDGTEKSTVYDDIVRAQSIVQWVRNQGIKDVWLDFSATGKDGAKYQCYTSEPPKTMSKAFADACFDKKGTLYYAD